MRSLLVVALSLFVVSCVGDHPVAPDPLLDSTLTAAAVANPVAKPFRASVDAATLQFGFLPCVPLPGFPPPDPEYCAARCSVPATWVFIGSAQGRGTHVGKFQVSFEHCSIVTFGPQGPIDAVYGDGMGVLVAANGDQLFGAYGAYGADGNGISYPVSADGLSAFEDTFVFTGGTGRFARASGSAFERGLFDLARFVFTDWGMEGTLSYAASDVSR